jgi:hypothetical protein
MVLKIHDLKHIPHYCGSGKRLNGSHRHLEALLNMAATHPWNGLGGIAIRYTYNLMTVKLDSDQIENCGIMLISPAYGIPLW